MPTPQPEPPEHTGPPTRVPQPQTPPEVMEHHVGTPQPQTPPEFLEYNDRLFHQPQIPALSDPISLVPFPIYTLRWMSWEACIAYGTGPNVGHCIFIFIFIKVYNQE